MLSKTQSKYIRSLALQKFRKENQSFLAEGEKIAAEWLDSTHKIDIIAGVQDWLNAHKKQIEQHSESSVIVLTEEELKQISTLHSPNKALLVVKDLPQNKLSEIDNWCIALDGIRDPGNMGTILRIADWFGIMHVVCSPDCVDVYSPKVVQAAMGAHLRVKIYETNIENFIKNSPLPAIAAVLGGTNVYEMPSINKGIIVIGNEGKGLSQSLIQQAQYTTTIPRRGGAESLNAAVSTGILCALFLGK